MNHTHCSFWLLGEGTLSAVFVLLGNVGHREENGLTSA
jgi:hypothetical protein